MPSLVWGMPVFGVFEEDCPKISEIKDNVDPHVLNNEYLKIPANQYYYNIGI